MSEKTTSVLPTTPQPVAAVEADVVMGDSVEAVEKAVKQAADDAVDGAVAPKVRPTFVDPVRAASIEHFRQKNPSKHYQPR